MDGWMWVGVRGSIMRGAHLRAAAKDEENVDLKTHKHTHKKRIKQAPIN